jgi:hypothetical protein
LSFILSVPVIWIAPFSYTKALTGPPRSEADQALFSDGAWEYPFQPIINMETMRDSIANISTINASVTALPSDSECFAINCMPAAATFPW